MSNGDFYPCSQCGKEVYRKDEHDCPVDAIDNHEDRINELELCVLDLQERILKLEKSNQDGSGVETSGPQG